MKLLKVTSFAKSTGKHFFCNTEITILGHLKSSGTVILLNDNSNFKSPKNKKNRCGNIWIHVIINTES
jgi:hypothetical protein